MKDMKIVIIYPKENTEGRYEGDTLIIGKPCVIKIASIKKDIRSFDTIITFEIKES